MIIDPNIKYEDYTDNETVKEFLLKIQEWKDLNNVYNCDFNDKNKDEVKRYMNMPYDKIRSMNSNEVNYAAYFLHRYVQYLYGILGKEQSILDWANESIYYIVSDKINDYGDGYTKWEQKFYSAVKENPLAKEIFKLKTNSLSRVKSIEKTIYPIEKMANTLEQIGRNKS